jgi:hypothetical protein
MRRRAIAIALSLAFAVPLLAAQAASAATEIGDNCTGDRAEPTQPMIVELASATGALPVTAPVAGVVTKWNVSVISYPGGISEQLKILRPAAGAPNTFTNVGESTSQPIIGGANTFETRIPIAVGDRIGAFGSALGAVYCAESSAPGDVMGQAGTNIANGATTTFTPLAKARPALSATIEPDVDGDGYGDETQDKCPQSAASHDPCPVLVLDAVSQAPGKGAVKILVAAGTEASITVSASATLPKAPKKARASTVAKLAPIVQLVTPGKFATYTMNYTGKLKQALAALPKSKSIKLKVKAEGLLTGGSATKKTLTVTLKGQQGS